MLSANESGLDSESRFRFPALRKLRLDLITIANPNDIKVIDRFGA